MSRAAARPLPALRGGLSHAGERAPEAEAKRLKQRQSPGCCEPSPRPALAPLSPLPTASPSPCSAPHPTQSLCNSFPSIRVTSKPSAPPATPKRSCQRFPPDPPVPAGFLSSRTATPSWGMGGLRAVSLTALLGILIRVVPTIVLPVTLPGQGLAQGVVALELVQGTRANCDSARGDMSARAALLPKPQPGAAFPISSTDRGSPGLQSFQGSDTCPCMLQGGAERGGHTHTHREALSSTLGTQVTRGQGGGDTQPAPGDTQLCHYPRCHSSPRQSHPCSRRRRRSASAWGCSARSCT